MAEEYVLELKGITKIFPGVKALNKVQFQLKPGEVHALMGENGAGKSTFIKAIVGMQKLDSGNVKILERKIPDREVLGKLGYMAQEDALFKELTGKQNLEFFGPLQGIKKKDLQGKLDKAAATVNLIKQLNQSISNNSGGMQRRLSLAIALQTDAPILLLDEPTVGIDPELRQEIWEELRNQANQGKTILITTHVMDEAERCDVILMLRNGKFIAEGSPKEIKEKYQVASVEEAFIVAGKNLELQNKGAAK